MSIATTASMKKRRTLKAAEALKARKAREAAIIADLLDTPSKKRGSTRRLQMGQRSPRLAVHEASDGGESSALSSIDSDSEVESNDSDSDDNDDNESDRDSDNDNDNNDSSGCESDSSDEQMFSDSSCDEETANTSDEDYESDGSLHTKRQRQGPAAWTPRKRRGGLQRTLGMQLPKNQILGKVTSTPHLPARPLNMTTLTLQDVEGLSAQARAKRLLHVGATPERLPCREDQYEEVMACVEEGVQDGVGGCVYVSGVPGVGKTATIREAIRSLKQRASAGLLSPFKFVEINGMKLNDAQDAYGLLWQTLSGMRCSNRMALRLLSQHFSKGPRIAHRLDDVEKTTVVLMDELDQLVTTRQEVMYNMFNWPNSRNSRLIVIAVANTMDLPERILNPKVASRLGMTRITFKPYNDKELVEIVHSRLGVGLDPTTGSEVEQALLKDCHAVFAPEAIVYISKRVSNVSGDARRMLDVCRRAIDSVEMEAEEGGQKKVTIGDVKKVLDSMVKSGKVSHLIKLPLQAKVSLISILACSRRSGVAETDLASIVAHQRMLCRMQAIPHVVDLQTMSPVLAHLCSLGLVIAVGSGAGSGKAGIYSRFLLACQEDEVRLALEQDQDRRLRNML